MEILNIGLATFCHIYGCNNFSMCLCIIYLLSLISYDKESNRVCYHLLRLGVDLNVKLELNLKCIIHKTCV